ncbi:hypothetical protein DYGSA30_29370 [Dyella sp. GSA-30]|nr:hypothetical protein DYGSA30_29370 [Dyella sp. GSA-30]
MRVALTDGAAIAVLVVTLPLSANSMANVAASGLSEEERFMMWLLGNPEARMRSRWRRRLDTGGTSIKPGQ